jgi:hypothetical protein
VGEASPSGVLKRSGGLAAYLPEAKGFSAGVAPAKQTDRCNQGKAELHEELASIEPIDWIILQSWIREEAVNEKRGGGEIDAEVKGLPKPAAQSKTQIGSNNHESQEIQRDSTNGVLQRLAGRVDWVDEV